MLLARAGSPAPLTQEKHKAHHCHCWNLGMHDAMSGAWKFDALFHTKRAEDRRFETGRAMENVLATSYYMLTVLRHDRASLSWTCNVPI